MSIIYRRYVDDPTTSERELHARTGQPVEIVRQLTNEECDPENQPMYLVRFTDGFEADAFGDELHEEKA